jgi:hypothetical protein
MDDQGTNRASGGSMSRIYLIREINCYLEKTGFDSIWISNHQPDLNDYEKHSVKLTGPLPTADADKYLEQLRAVLETAGLEVLDEAVADD